MTYKNPFHCLLICCCLLAGLNACGVLEDDNLEIIPRYDCPNLVAMIGDSCVHPDGFAGLVGAECSCDSLVPVDSFDCPRWSSGFGGFCTTPDSLRGTVDSACFCVPTGARPFCPDLMLFVFDSCVLTQDSMNVTYGTVSSLCECN